MAIRTIDDTSLYNIANAIRDKLGSDETFKPSEMSDKIESIPVGEPDWTEIGYGGAPDAVLNGFEYAKTIQNSWDPTVTDRHSGFNYAVSKQNLSIFPAVDTSGIVNANNMFSGCTGLFAIPKMDLSSCTNAAYMFNGCYALKSAEVGPFANAATIQKMFGVCSSLQEVTVDATGVQNTSELFIDCVALKEPVVINTESIKYANSMFRSMWWLATDIDLDLPECLECYNMFENSFQYNLNAHGTDYGYGTDDSAAVYDITLNIPKCQRLNAFCYGGNVGNGGLKSVHLTTSSALLSMNNMFEGGHANLETIEISDTSGCTNFYNAFIGCPKLVNLSTLDFSSVTNMSSLQNLISVQTANLSDESLDGILAACLGSSVSSGNKTLAYMGFNSSVYPVSRLSQLDHWEAFIDPDSGWSTGY